MIGQPETPVNDKYAKVRPFYDQLNEQLVQFGVFSKHLSIDESMVPYFGNHSGKMFIKGKLIRFGYKIWVLCSSGGFPYRLQLYEEKKEDNQPLGLQMSNRLNYFIRNFYPIRIVFGSFEFFLTKFSHSDSFFIHCRWF